MSHTLKIQGQGHTVGCLLRPYLVEHADFAACVVPHPDDDFLLIKLDCANPQQLVRDAIKDAEDRLDALEALIQSHVDAGRGVQSMSQE